MEQGKTYLFLDNHVWSPKEIKNTFGKEVTIDKIRREEVWFTFLDGKKGYIVYPNLFCENTPNNQLKINKLKELSKEVDELERQANKLSKTIKRGLK